MGPITCTNVLSDRYAVRITDCDNMLIIACRLKTVGTRRLMIETPKTSLQFTNQ